MKVLFNDLAAQYASMKESIDEALHAALHEFNFVRGSQVKRFEETFIRELGVANCIATGNGTDSLFLILKALGIGKDDEVITPAFSWISSAEVISLTGATPVFADVHPEYYTIDETQLEKLITPSTRAVIAVHLYGQSASLSSLKKICERHRLLLIEDCAQAHFSKDENSFTGTIGHASAFSFYPTKNLGAYGDAGCVVTNDNVLAEKIRRLANHGALMKDDHQFEGLNSRMDTLQAAVLLAKLPELAKWNLQRIAHATQYKTLLQSVDDVILPAVRIGSFHTFHLFVIRTKQRNELKKYLDAKDVKTLIHYPVALPNLDAYQYLKNERENFPVAGLLQNEVLSLPVHPELTSDQIAYVCENIKEFFQK